MSEVTKNDAFVVTENYGAKENPEKYIKEMKEKYDAMGEHENDTIGERMKDTIVADTPASHESTASVEASASQQQVDAVNAEKDAKSEVVMSTLKNVLPQWARKLIENPIISAVAVGMFAGPLAGVAAFGAGTLGKQFVKMNDTINAYKNKLVEDKDIKLNKDGTLAYTGTSTIMGADIYKPTVCYYKPNGMNPTGVDAEDKSSYDVPKPHQPQSPPSVDDTKKKEESKKEEVKKEDPKKETSKKEEPKKEEPKKEEPKKEEVKQEAPKTEEPKKEEVKPAEPKQEAPTIPEPVGGVNPTVPENQPTVEIPAPINPAPTTETKSADNGDVIVTKPRVIKVGEKEDAEEVDSKSNKETSTGDKEHTTDSDVGIWENRDDIDPNDTKDNKGGDYSHNDDNKSVSSAYQDLIKSLTESSTPSVDDGPDL